MIHPLEPAHSPFDALLERAQSLAPIEAAIVDPLDSLSLGGALSAASKGLIKPVLVGDPNAIYDAANRCGWSLRHARIVHASPGEESAAAVALAAGGHVKIVVKGALHSDALLHSVLAEPRLLTGRRLSHVVVFELPQRENPLIVTDGAVNIAPNLEQKAQIVQNAIDVARTLGLELPKVAILAAVETVVSGMTATIDAAALSEMARRGQITGALVDGPLALDDALSIDAAGAKHIDSPVAGCADVLVAPDLQSGNILYKAFDVLLRARFGAVIAGAAVPIVFTSRADSIEARVLSCVLARLLAEEKPR
ncbi:MAG TPA: bifunctional enoyl-CoA hydratase/phosphate acetyltransferase [Candidatus Baltobacteraceae bacterium]|nr:bifunctional enoyl-CoA hydratase/phosphate acetyltransferase [Candidatus Baltobacteraceae bacterium]